MDYAVFAEDASSPFNAQVTHPLVKDSGDNDWLTDLDKLTSRSGLSLLGGANTDAHNWLNSVRHDVTFGSRAEIVMLRTAVYAVI